MFYSLGQIINDAPPCQICASREIKIVALRGRHYQKLTTAICTGCGLIHSHPIPTEEELAKYYHKEYRSAYKNAFTPQKKHILRYAKNAKNRLERLLQFCKEKNSKLLDIGSGSGEFVYAAKLSGFDALGIEPHVGYSNYSKKTFNIDVRNWRFQNAEFDEQSFDIITIHHVLEHLQNPLNSLIEISKWLKFEGLLIVDVPDIETSMHSPINRFHYAHIYNFNHQTLRAILTKAGFELLEHRSNHSGTVLAAKKINQANVNLNIAMPDNYEKLWQILTKKEQALNYRKKTKIKRFFSKCWRYPKEFLQAAISADNKKIVEKQLKS